MPEFHYVNTETKKGASRKPHENVWIVRIHMNIGRWITTSPTKTNTSWDASPLPRIRIPGHHQDDMKQF